MSDLREALDDILRLCHQSRTYTRRVQTIHEVAMQALGMTAGQREARHVAILQRTAGDPGVRAYREREEKRRLKQQEKETTPP